MALGSDASNRMGSPQAVGTTFYNKTIDQSLRFEDGDEPALSKTFSTTQTNTKKITVSVWVKRTNIGLRQAIIFAKDGSSGFLEFNTSDQLVWNAYNTGYTSFTSDAQFRDTSTWYHIVAVADSEEPPFKSNSPGNTSSGQDIHKIYVNGELISGTRTGSFVPEDTATMLLRNGVTTYIGDDTDGSYHFDGYMAEMHVVDGTIYGPEYFGEDKNGVWVPKVVNSSTISYGNNGFHLDFSGGVGGFSAYFAGGTDVITFTTGSTANIGSSDDFCFEFWAQHDAGSTYYYIAGYYTTSGPHGAFQFSNGDVIYWYTGNGAAIGPYDYTSVKNPNAFQHYAVVRESGRFYVYVDGNDISSGGTTSGGTAAYDYSTSNFLFGDAHPTAGAPHFNGYISNFRLTVGSARYPGGSSFTPATSLTADSTNVKLLAFTNSNILDDASSFNLSGAITSGTPVFSTYGPAGGSLLSEDRSGQNNHFASSGVNSGDVLPDSPTNNMAVLSAVNKYSNAVGDDVREGGLEERGNSTGYAGTVTFDATDEKGFYFEVTQTGTPGSGCTHGFMNFTDSINQYGGIPGDSDRSGFWGVYRRGAGGSNQFWYYLDGVETATLGVAGSANDVWMYLIKAGKFYIGRNGTWFNSGDPAAGTGYYATGLTGTDWTIFCGNGHNVTGGHQIRVSRDTWSHGVASYKEVKALNMQEPAFSPREDNINNSYFYTTIYEGNGGGQRVGQFLPLTETKSVNNAVSFLDNHHLDRTATAGNQSTWTFSAWIKRAELGTTQYIWTPYNGGDGSNESSFRFNTSDQINVYDSGATRGQVTTTRVFRDTSSWMHLVLVVDLTESSNTDRVKIYVDGELQEVTINNAVGTAVWGWNANSNAHRLGGYARNTTENLVGYMADVHFADGAAYAPTFFGQTDPSTEKWIPKTVTGVTYGTNGFHLEFLDNSSFGADSAGSTTWTTTGLATHDQVVDTPTNNFPILDDTPGNFSGATLAEGNRQLTGASSFSSSAFPGARSTVAIPKSGKWYCEVRGMSTGDSWAAGVNIDSDYPNSTTVSGPNSITVYNRSVMLNGIENDYGASENQLAGLGVNKFQAGDVLGIHIDMDNDGKIWFSRNGTQFDAPQGHQGGSGPQGDPAAGTNEIGSVFNPDDEELYFIVFAGSSAICHVNFGQNPSFNNSFTGGDVGTQVREGGTFKYMPATGYKPLRVDLLPDQTRDVARRKKPVITWIKNRDSTDSHMLFDSLRGPTKVAHPDVYASETTEVNTLQKFVPGGFQIGNDVQVNTAGESYVAWNWCMHDNVVEDVPTGSGFSNGRRLVDKRVGLSVVTYTATASTGTIDHGLGVTPDMIIATDRGHDTQWFVWHSGLANASAGTHIMNLDSGAAEFNPGINHLNDTAPTANAFAFGGYMGAHSDTSAGGQTKMFYAFKSVPGYSKFGFYIGDADADGTFVHLGFRPAWLMIADTTTTNIEWNIYDSTRSTGNVMNDYLAAASSGTEDVNVSTRNLDFVSNGIKFRDQYAQNYQARHIYWAMAEAPFKYANAR